MPRRLARPTGAVEARPVTGRVRRLVGTALLLALGVGLVGAMLGLARWQWGKARAQGSLLNYSYAAEWLVFAVLTVIALLWLALEGRREPPPFEGPAEAPGTAPGPAPAGRGVPLVGPPLRPGEQLEELTWVRLRRRLGLVRPGSAHGAVPPDQVRGQR